MTKKLISKSQKAINPPKHGINSKHFLSRKEKKKFNRHLVDLTPTFSPNGLIEEKYVTQIAMYLVILDRITEAETSYISKGTLGIDSFEGINLIPSKIEGGIIHLESEEITNESTNTMIRVDHLTYLERFNKYHTSITNKLHKTIKELYKLKKMAKGEFQYVDIGI